MALVHRTTEGEAETIGPYEGKAAREREQWASTARPYEVGGIHREAPCVPVARVQGKA